jgi:hypothetical protein
MKHKNIISISSILILITLSLSNVSSLEAKNISKNSLINSAELPTWNNGSYWKYDMNFNFKTSIFEVKAKILDLSATVKGEEQINGKPHYRLKIDSASLTGTVTISFLEGPDIRGIMTGYAYVDKNTLGMTKFIFSVNGEVNYLTKWHELKFDMTMTFKPSFDFLNFPINTNEDFWNVDIDEATISASVDIHIIGGQTIHKEYSETDEFEDKISLKDVKEVNYPNLGTFETFIVGGDWGVTSNLYYAPDLGFLAKVEETLNIKGVIADFYLDLKETNYKVGNSAPEKPIISCETTIGETRKQYEFTADSTDKESDKLEYVFDWGDGSNSGWLGPYNSQENCLTTHMWLNKGVYSIVAKARDEEGLESPYSDPYAITITGNPHIFFTINKIHMNDDIDVGSEAELFYELKILSENYYDRTVSYYNTDNGYYIGNWNTGNNWEPNVEHEIEMTTQKAMIYIKVMDYDGTLEGGSDDLADVSGCNKEDNDGTDNSIQYKRGAVFHQTYDLVNDDLGEYSAEPDDYLDYYIPSSDVGRFITCGDFQPDSSTEHEGGLLPGPQNDAEVCFTIRTDYKKPEAKAEIIDAPNRVCTNAQLSFKGSVLYGTPGYSWEWFFGDGSTSNIQNPIYSFSSAGKYTVTLVVTDGFNQENSYSFEINVYQNNKPSNLNIQGPTKGKKDVTYEYIFSATDPDNDQLYYRIDWGDSTQTNWLGPYSSGYQLSQNHCWANKQTYSITLEAKDEYDAVSSTTVKVQMPKQICLKNKIIYMISEMLKNVLPIS